MQRWSLFQSNGNRKFSSFLVYFLVIQTSECAAGSASEFLFGPDQGP